MLETIRTLYELGGIISGGAAVASIFNKRTKDLDFFFNDMKYFIKAQSYASPKIDICYYSGPEPYDGFDLSISQCAIDSNGIIRKSAACQETLESGIIRIIPTNIAHPYSTLKRIIKYTTRYNLQIHPSDLAYVRGAACGRSDDYQHSASHQQRQSKLLSGNP